MSEAESSVTKRGWYRFAAAVVVCAVAVAFGVFVRTRPHADDEKGLQGVWVSDKTSFRLTVTGNRMVEEFVHGPTPFFFRLGPRASPKRIIMCLADRPTRPEWYILGMSFGPPVADDPEWEFHGIYELEGDRLRLCLPKWVPSGTDFPTSFAPTTKCNVIEFRRP